MIQSSAAEAENESSVQEVRAEPTYGSMSSSVIRLFSFIPIEPNIVLIALAVRPCLPMIAPGQRFRRTLPQ